MKERSQNNSCASSPCVSPRGFPLRSKSLAGRTTAQTDSKLDEGGNSLETYSGTAGAPDTGGGGVGVGAGGGGVGVGAGGATATGVEDDDPPPPPQAVRNAQLATEAISSLIDFVMSHPYKI